MQMFEHCTHGNEIKRPRRVRCVFDRGQLQPISAYAALQGLSMKCPGGLESKHVKAVALQRSHRLAEACPDIEGTGLSTTLPKLQELLRLTGERFDSLAEVIVRPVFLGS
jgi:hypothetical protein